MSKKFESVAEVREERKKINDKFKGKLPDYLADYFDDEELRQIDNEFYRERAKIIRETPAKEKKAFLDKKKEEFWAENETELVKRPKRIGSHLEPVYEEPTRASERVEQERELTDEEIRVLVQISAKDLQLFAIRYFPHYLKKPDSKFHKFLYNKLSREFNKSRKVGLKLAIAAPRGNSKSSVISAILPIWCAAYKKKKFIIIISDTAGQAEDFLTDIKLELDTNEKLRRDFPELCERGPIWRVNEIITGNGVKMMVLGTGSKIRGRKFGVDRPDLILMDDLENADMVRSLVQREFIRYQWFDKDVMFAGGEEGSITDFIVIGTIIGKDALLTALTDPKEYPNWQSKRLAAVEEFSDSPLWDEWYKLFTDHFDINREETALAFFEDHRGEMLEGTKVLWPEGDPYYNLMIWKYTKTSAFMSEKMCSPLDPTKIIVSKEELHWENFATSLQVQEALKHCDFFGALDPSLGKKTKRADYSCILTIARIKGTGFMFVVDINIKKRTVDHQIEDILKLHDKFKYKLFAVETNAFQLVIADNLRKLSKRYNIYIPIKDLPSYTDKKMRFEGIVPLIKDGTIIFDVNRYNHNHMYRLGMEQIYTFTGENDEHDDAADGLIQCVEIAKKPRFRTITKKTRHKKR